MSNKKYMLCHVLGKLPDWQHDYFNCYDECKPIETALRKNSIYYSLLKQSKNKRNKGVKNEKQ